MNALHERKILPIKRYAVIALLMLATVVGAANPPTNLKVSQGRSSGSGTSRRVEAVISFVRPRVPSGEKVSGYYLYIRQNNRLIGTVRMETNSPQGVFGFKPGLTYALQMVTITRRGTGTTTGGLSDAVWFSPK